MASLRAGVEGVVPDSFVRRTVWLLALVLLPLATLVVLNGGGAHSASGPVSLNGDWAPFSRCPVDDPAMLAADAGGAPNWCLATESSSGSIKLGNTAATSRG